MSVQVTLICDGCGVVSNPRPYLRMTRWGVYRLMGGTEFVVDGGGCWCPGCAPETTDWNVQRGQTWSEADAADAERADEHRASLDALIDRNPGVAARVRERGL